MAIANTFYLQIIHSRFFMAKMTIAEHKLNIFDCHNISSGSRNADLGNEN